MTVPLNDATDGVSLLKSTPRWIGVDVGTKRVGIARSDPLGMFAQAYGTFAPDEAVDELCHLHDEDGIEVLVVGWPLSPEGEENDATAFVDAFVDDLNEQLSDLEVVRQDERFSSEIAIGNLREAGVRQPGRYDKGEVDAAAAAVILQDYLDAR